MQNKQIIRIFLPILLLFISCEKQEGEQRLLLEGSYTGIITTVNTEANFQQPAVADIKELGDGLLEIHCYSEEFDTIFRLNYYQHNEQYMVCATEEDFEHMYGHALSANHMSKVGMMNETEWMYHLRQEHSESDKHFGQFGMADHSFEYLFVYDKDDHLYNLRFRGIKR
ncbi:hypothetical protein [Salegentibacter chungangensis]|uniref:Uncharacterized protein n=1 Tax=Salegentibacter chungangensis TaxID=1335724 RepID=A0ABW3NM75_9FLAO